MKYGGCVYIITNFYNTVLYVGVTTDLRTRILQHKNKEFKNSFTSKYNCDKLVWFQSFSRIEEAIAIEKQVKSGNRKRKEDLIHGLNSQWNDLWNEIQHGNITQGIASSYLLAMTLIFNCCKKCL